MVAMMQKISYCSEDDGDAKESNADNNEEVD